jgi:peptide-methionine (S)-S-oxide reductase
MAIATLAGGCFWCLEAVFEQLKGVDKVVSGYMGGQTENPSYEAVCTGATGHAEVVQITYAEDVIGFGDLLDVFFTIHDPTTLNRQGNDIGTQYRSAVFYHDETQRQITEEKVGALTEAGIWNNPIITEITEAETFYPAEDYHQGYFRNNPTQGYCAAVVAPKVAKFRKQHLDRLKA